jgi:hypothetical protein
MDALLLFVSLHRNEPSTQYRALLEAGTDPATLAGWIREVETEKIAINARLRQLGGRAIVTTAEMTAIVHALGDLVLSRPELGHGQEHCGVFQGFQRVPGIGNHQKVSR